LLSSPAEAAASAALRANDAAVADRNRDAGARGCATALEGVFAGRADRAFRNLLETFPIFAVLALALVVTGRNGGLGALGAEAWIVTRILYVPLYFIQIPFARSLVWFVSIFALVAMLVRLFQ
jgi:uncharacterized MAPEG superfamily protein